MHPRTYYVGALHAPLHHASAPGTAHAVRSPGADVAGVSPVPVQMWQRRARSQCRCGRGAPSPGADVAGVGPVSRVQISAGGKPSPGADAVGAYADLDGSGARVDDDRLSAPAAEYSKFPREYSEYPHSVVTRSVRSIGLPSGASREVMGLAANT